MIIQNLILIQDCNRVPQVCQDPLLHPKHQKKSLAVLMLKCCSQWSSCREAAEAAVAGWSTNEFDRVHRGDGICLTPTTTERKNTRFSRIPFFWFFGSHFFEFLVASICNWRPRKKWKRCKTNCGRPRCGDSKHPPRSPQDAHGGSPALFHGGPNLANGQLTALI